MKPSVDEYEQKERERICNLSRDDLIREYVDGMSLSELMELAMETMHQEDRIYDNDYLRHQLLQAI